ncbi:MAG: ABC transporter permease [Chloroflexi bacterium]|nr:ABC transporter permease [Chloroflexota bacterium]
MRYILRRLGFYLVAFWAALTIDFFLPRLLPGDPAATILGQNPNLTPVQIDALRKALGLTNAPLPIQYLTYLGQVFHLNFGVSFSRYPAPVTDVISTGLVWTILLGTTALIIAFVVGNFLGVVGSWRRGGLIDTVFPPLLILFGAFPPFFLALTALFFLALQLGWFPTSHAYADTLSPGWDGSFILSVLHSLVLPAAVIVLVSIGGWALGMRNVMVGVLAEDYIVMAEAKGLKQRRIMFWYAARNALLPSITSFGLALGAILSGQILIEQVFNYPGLGFLLIQSVGSRDYPLMQGLFLIITTAVLAANFIVDVIYTRLDPRVRAG